MSVGVDDDIFEALLDVVTRFTRERLIPNEGRVEAEDEIPPEIVKEMAEMGLYGMSISEEYGGLGLSTLQEARLVEALCYASLSYRSLIGTNVGIGSQGIQMHGTEAQKREWLPKLATGEASASFALTEPDVGSDAAHIKTTARREGDHFVINGSKRYITNALRASVCAADGLAAPPLSTPSRRAWPPVAKSPLRVSRVQTCACFYRRRMAATTGKSASCATTACPPSLSRTQRMIRT